MREILILIPILLRIFEIGSTSFQNSNFKNEMKVPTVPKALDITTYKIDTSYDDGIVEETLVFLGSYPKWNNYLPARDRFRRFLLLLKGTMILYLHLELNMLI